MLVTDTNLASPTDANDADHYAAVTAAARDDRLVDGLITIGSRSEVVGYGQYHSLAVSVRCGSIRSEHAAYRAASARSKARPGG